LKITTLDKEISELKDQIEKMKTDFENQFALANSKNNVDQENALKSLKKNYEDEMDKLKKKYEAYINEKNKKCENELEELNSIHNGKIKELEAIIAEYKLKYEELLKASQEVK